MLVPGLNYNEYSNNKHYYSNCELQVISRKTLAQQVMEEVEDIVAEADSKVAQVLDVEEGEISDTASVEEITEQDFHKQDEITSPSPTAADVAAEVKITKNVNSCSNNNNALNNCNSINNSVTNDNNSNANNNQKGASRVWTMRDLYKYQISRNYAPGLYNLAWAQAVQNKPLDELFVKEYPTSDGDEGDNKANSNSSMEVLLNGEGKDTGRVVIDVKEEGELEEGEIDLDSDVVMDITDVSKMENEVKVDDDEGKRGLEGRVDSIRKGLESLTSDDAEKSFEQVCSKLQSLLKSLQEIDHDHFLSEKDSLIQMSFAAIQTVNTVFCSMNPYQKEQNRDILLRSIGSVTSQGPLLFSAQQLEEIEVLISSLGLYPVSSNVKESVAGGVVDKIDSNAAPKKCNQDLTYLKTCDVDVDLVGMSDINVPPVLPEYSTLGLSSFKQRGVSLPLLDLHKDHDVDSLPSPTREAPPPLPLDRAFGLGHGVLKPEWPVPRVALATDKLPVHPYETDALKAVSSYQQKFGRTSILQCDKLPSPTPSDDGDNGDGDICGEVSSASFSRNVHPVLSSIKVQPPVSVVPKLGILSGQGLTNNWSSSPLTSGPGPALKSSNGKRIRDPRLRLASSEAPAGDHREPDLPLVNTESRVFPSIEMVDSRKQRTVEEPTLDGPALKRQRNEITGLVASKDVPALSRSGGWLENRGTLGLPVPKSNNVLETTGSDSRRGEHAGTSAGTCTNSVSVRINGSENLPVPSPAATASLQSLLKDIAVNPSLWMNLIKMEQQKSADAKRSSIQTPSSNSILGTVPMMTVAPSKPSVLRPKVSGVPQTPPQTLPSESAKLRMKPRDPRRLLHSDASHNGGGSGSDQTKIIPSLQKQEDQSGSPRSSELPDIGRQFIKNLKNIGDIMSISPATTSQAAVSQMLSTQTTEAHQVKADNGMVLESRNLRTSASLATEDVVGPSRPQHSWNDVEHLFEGFDDKQKAAIQRERARRISEQRKMFAARKLCLVLDLDHTLLNSAKFGEVDPVHNEILRKKEEQDREQPQRHLFRFPHMSMWTKLRPGIWNFLEKASKLFELHLYTMGNKLYATEMAKLLDPKGELFAGRVISKGDDGDINDGDERIPKSKDLEGVLGMESAVVIIDDSVRVWPHNKLNLIVVERYIYFPCSRRQFGLLGPSLLEIDHDERPEAGTLASSLAVIERIHQNFFAHRSLEEADVRNILAAEQRKILAGCRIVFSRVFPVGEVNPHLHPLWQTAEQFGAACTTQIDEEVTHVVANSLGTDKVNWAISNGKFVVHPGWVEASALLYRRAHEHDFAIKPQ